MVTPYIPKKGDIILLNFHPQKGKEQAGIRPALVLSPEEYNKKVGLAILCPITQQEKGYPFEVALNKKQKTKGVILADHVKNLDWQERGAKYKEKVEQATLDIVLDKLGILLFASK